MSHFHPRPLTKTARITHAKEVPCPATNAACFTYPLQELILSAVFLEDYLLI